MTDVAALTAGHLAITAFVLLVIDRTAALFVASRKAKRVLAKKNIGADTPTTLHVRSIRWLQEWYWVLQAAIFLLSFYMLGILQIINPMLIHDEVGKMMFASVGFLISFGCSTMNALIEELDRQP